MSNLGDRPLGGFGLRSERGGWFVTVSGVVLTLVAVVMAIVDSEPVLWLTTAAGLLAATGIGVYSIVWFRRRSRQAGSTR